MNIACILAGGLGLRLTQEGLPKQYRMLCQKPVLLYSMQAFDQCDQIDLICIVAARAYHHEIRRMADDARIQTPIVLALPGTERFASAYAALLAVSHLCDTSDILLFHDAARPLVNDRIISDNIRLAKQHDGVYTAIPSTDSVFVSDNGKTLAGLLDRRTLWQGQTPQSFRYGIIKRAHEQYRDMKDPPAVTDDCSLVHLFGGKIAVCMGDRRNMKLTTPEDLLLLEALVLAEPNQKE